jgi:DNA topoisomerase-3
MMAERGVSVDHATIHRWVIRYSPELLKRFNSRKRVVTRKCHIDETYIKVRGGWTTTRDTILPKLQKSQYVELLKGKDPPIQVTEVGLTFIAAVRRVFPAYGDPVGRVMFEADLAEIGRAATRAGAARRGAAYQERTRSGVGELITTIGQSGAVALDPTYLPMPTAADGKPPTKAMIAFAASIAAQRGLKLPQGLKTNSAICRTFLDQHAPQRSSGPARAAPQMGPRPPSEAMARYARSLAEQKGIECTPAVLADFAVCRTFLDAHSPKAQHPQEKNQTATPKGRRPAVRAGNSDGAPKRMSASVRKPTETRAKAPRQPSKSHTVASGKDE